MAVKLVVTDLDGTMFDKSEELPDFALSISALLTQKGIGFCFATGRSMSAARGWMQTLQTTAPCVLLNGALLAGPDKTLEAHSFPAAPLRDILCEAHSRQLSVILSGEAYGDDIPMGVTPFIRRGRSDRLLYPDVRPPSEEQWQSMSLQKITIIDDLKRVEPMYQALRSRRDVVCVYYGSGGMEIMPAGCNKAAGVESLCRYLDITPGEVLAIGNDANDVELLRLCGASSAVSNAGASALDCAGYRCTRPLAHGVLEAIERFC